MQFDRKLIYNEKELENIIQKFSINFFDFGCSRGGATTRIQKLTKKIGFGFDISQKKIIEADNNGILCACVDILKISKEKIIEDIIMFHFLEHLNSVGEAKIFIEKAVSLAKSSVVIKQPFFDADCLLLNEGLKTCYSHWTGHPNRMTTFDFYYMLFAMKQKNIISDFEISYKKRITNSESDLIVPYSAHIDTLAYDINKHGKKHTVTFSYSLFYEIMVALDIDGSGYGEIYKTLEPDEILKI